MNNMQKMRYANSIIQKELKAKGFYDIEMFPHTRFSKDVWGMFDGVCKKTIVFYGKKDDISSVEELYSVVWLQFKTDYASKEDKQKLEKFSNNSTQKVILAEMIDVNVRYKDWEDRKKKKESISYKKQEVKLTKWGFE